MADNLAILSDCVFYIAPIGAQRMRHIRVLDAPKKCIDLKLIVWQKPTLRRNTNEEGYQAEWEEECQQT